MVSIHAYVGWSREEGCNPKLKKHRAAAICAHATHERDHRVSGHAEGMNRIPVGVDLHGGEGKGWRSSARKLIYSGFTLWGSYHHLASS